MIEICNFFLVLNLTMCIKPFTFINTIFSVSFLNDISPFNIFVFFKHTIIELHLKLDRRLLTDDWLSKTFISDIPSQMHPFSITVWWFVYNICVNFYFQKFWLIHICYHFIGNMTCGSWMFDLYVPHFDSWISLNTFLSSFLLLFSFFALAGNNYIHVS